MSLKLIKNGDWTDPNYIVPEMPKPKQAADWYTEVSTNVRNRFPDGEAPAHFKKLMSRPQLHSYMRGCSHNVQYNKAKRSKLYNSPTPVPCEVKENVNQLLLTVEHGDPFMWLDLKYRCTYNHIIARQGQLLTLQTRSDLCAHDDYIAVLDKNYHRIEIVLGPDDTSVCMLKEPGAPSNKRRMAAYNKLRELGYMVFLKPYKSKSKQKSA